jgi:hypothetical protein
VCSTDSSGTGAGSLTSLAEPGPAEHPSIPIALTRRRLVATTAALAVCPLPALPANLPVEPIAAIDRGEPFDDGTYFDDGFGWVD